MGFKHRHLFFQAPNTFLFLITLSMSILFSAVCSFPVSLFNMFLLCCYFGLLCRHLLRQHRSITDWQCESTNENHVSCHCFLFVGVMFCFKKKEFTTFSYFWSTVPGFKSKYNVGKMGNFSLLMRVCSGHLCHLQHQLCESIWIVMVFGSFSSCKMQVNVRFMFQIFSCLWVLTSVRSLVVRVTFSECRHAVFLKHCPVSTEFKMYKFL